MATTVELTEDQVKALGMISAGMSQGECADVMGVTRRTVVRWNNLPAFKEEVRRRDDTAVVLHQKKATQQQREEINDFYATLAEYKAARISIYKNKLSRSLKGLKKVGDRFDDLPSEAISPNNIAQLFNTFDGMAENAMQGWAELIGLEEMLRRLQDDETEE